MKEGPRVGGGEGVGRWQGTGHSGPPRGQWPLLGGLGTKGVRDRRKYMSLSLLVHPGSGVSKPMGDSWPTVIHY